MECDEIASWRPFKPEDGAPSVDLSFLDAHEITCVHALEGKPSIEYRFLVTYSFHCFAKDYPHLSDDQRLKLMYNSGKEKRPFCYRRYSLAKAHLRGIIENIHTIKVTIIHGGYGGYLATELVDEHGQKVWYLVSFKVYRQRKKYRLHVTSAYPVTERPGGGKVKFFTIAYNLAQGKALPAPAN